MFLGPLAVTLHDRRARDRAGRLVSRYLDGRPVPAPSRPPVPRVRARRSSSALARSPTRLFAIQIGGHDAVRGPRRDHARPSLEPLPSTRGADLRPTGTPLVSNIASYSVKIRPGGPARIAARRGRRTTLAALIGADPTEINVAIDSNPGSRFDLVRVAQDVDPEVAALHRRVRPRSCRASRSSSRRAATTCSGPCSSQVLGYTGPIDGERARRPQGRRLPARRPARDGRRRVDVRVAAARHSTGSRPSSGTPPAARSRCSGRIRQPVAGSSLDADDRHARSSSSRSRRSSGG